MKKQINLIFPVAGKAERFGGTFKPFLYIGDKTFIETTYEPFKKWSSNIQKVVLFALKIKIEILIFLVNFLNL